eukprot:5104149-Lingulodinium_polyedra.AAC.1
MYHFLSGGPQPATPPQGAGAGNGSRPPNVGRIPGQPDRAPRQPVSALPMAPAAPRYRVWLRQWALSAVERQGSFQPTGREASEVTAAAAVLHE